MTSCFSHFRAPGFPPTIATYELVLFVRRSALCSRLITPWTLLLWSLRQWPVSPLFLLRGKQVNSFSHGFSPVEPQAIPLSAHPTLTGGVFLPCPFVQNLCNRLKTHCFSRNDACQSNKPPWPFPKLLNSKIRFGQTANAPASGSFYS